VSNEQPPSAWKPLIDDWVERERQLRPHLPVKGESVRVRDAVEVGDQAYVLLSFDVDHPWPTEENLGDSDARAAGAHTAVLQAERNRLPWRERDSTRSASSWSDADDTVVVHEHLLGTRRAFSGSVVAATEHVQLEFEDGDPVEATVVDGWFLAIVPDERRVRSVTLDEGTTIALRRSDVDALLAGSPFDRDSSDAMYFSPLDLRSVIPIVQWVRSGDVVAVATCIEQYDEGGILRLRIDGVRTDDDTFVTWPAGTLEIDGKEIGSSVCGESALADTISLDIGFRPWLPTSAREIAVRIDSVRGAQGELREPMVLAIRIPRPDEA
jgi:hypothetical protein